MTKYILFLITLFHTLSLSAIVKSDFVFEGDIIASVHASTIIETNDGRLLCAFFGGIEEKSPDTSIWLSTYKNGFWSKPIEFANGKSADSTRFAAWNPVLYRQADNNIYLSYKIGDSPRKWKGFYKVSKDEGLTWSKPIAFPDEIEGSVRTKSLLLDGGRVIIPSSTEFGSWFGWRTRFEITDNNGKSWKVSKPPFGLIQAIQPTIIKHKDGTIQSLMRSRSGKIATTFSKDNGCNWSPIELLDVDNPNSGLDAISLSDGSFVMICNPSNDSRRGRISIMSSKNGIDWIETLVLENDSENVEYSYPSIIESADGAIHVSYTWKRKSIKHVRFDLSDLKKGSLQ